LQPSILESACAHGLKAGVAIQLLGLALEAFDLVQRVRDRTAGDGDQNGVGVGDVASVLADARNGMAGPLPPVCQSAADIPLPTTAIFITPSPS
jgi:hypothetical protein